MTVASLNNDKIFCQRPQTSLNQQPQNIAHKQIFFCTGLKMKNKINVFLQQVQQ